MRVILAEPRGFCAGVNMAVDCLQRALELFGSPIYVYHEIVHNRWVVERFSKQGAIFVDGLSTVPAGSLLLYSAHGVSPEVRQAAIRRGLRTIDATCPLVTKVHLEALRFAKAGYTVILIGHAGHDEVLGTIGEAPDAIRLVQDVDEVDRLDLANTDKLAYLTQTTLSVDDAAAIIARLQERFPGIVGPPSDDICYATQNRQQTVRELAAEADLTLVVGSRNSSNSRRLAELASACGVAAHLVDGPDDIDLNWFSPDQTVLITAGASAPEDVVQLCVRLLEKNFPVTVQSRVTRREQTRFRLPRELR